MVLLIYISFSPTSIQIKKYAKHDEVHSISMAIYGCRITGSILSGNNLHTFVEVFPFLISPHYFEQSPTRSSVLVYGKINWDMLVAVLGRGVEEGEQT